MIYWDYRVFSEDGGYTIRTVYYDDRGAITACSEKPIEPFGESLEALQEELNRLFRTCVGKPRFKGMGHGA
jgi:hypothetical protein